MAITKRTRIKEGKRTVFYHAEVYVRSVRLADRTFENRTAAYVWHDEEKKRLLTKPTARTAESWLFQDCLNRYIEEAFSRLRKSSQQSMEARFPYFKEGPLCLVKMSEFCDRDVDDWLSWLLKQTTAKNPGRKTFLQELKHLTVILSWYRNSYDPSFVIPIVKRHRQRCVYKQVAPRRPDYFAKPDEIRAWLEWLRQNRNPVYYRLAFFMTHTGTRIGETCGLTWEQVDLERGTATIVKSVRWDQWTKQPFLEDCVKTDESVRLLMLPKNLVELLREMKLESSGSGPVFLSNRGELLKYNAVQSAFNQGFKVCGLPWRSTHICRHTFGTLALMATKDLSAVQASLGHKSRQVTERYAKSVAMLSSNTAEKTAELINLDIENQTVSTYCRSPSKKAL